MRSLGVERAGRSRNTLKGFRNTSQKERDDSTLALSSISGSLEEACRGGLIQAFQCQVMEDIYV